MKKKVKKTNKNTPVTKKDLNEATNEFKRYVGVVNEDFQHKTQVIAEQYLDINKKLDSHTEMIGNMAQDMSIIKEDIELIKGDLKKKVDFDEFSALERRVRVLEKRR